MRMRSREDRTILCFFCLVSSFVLFYLFYFLAAMDYMGFNSEENGVWGNQVQMSMTYSTRRTRQR